MSVQQWWGEDGTCILGMFVVDYRGFLSKLFYTNRNPGKYDTSS